MIGALPYLVNCIAISLCLYYIDKYVNDKKKWLFIAVAVILPCLIAAYRGIEVGTDLSFYGYKTYLQARDYPLEVYVTINPSFAPAYNIISWISAQLSMGSIEVHLFIIQLLSNLPFICALLVFDSQERWQGGVIYSLVIYPMTLNLIRQGIALAWCTLGYSILYKKNENKTPAVILAAAFVLIGSLFHTSALIGLVTLFIQILVSVVLPKAQRVAFMTIMGTILVLLILGYPMLVDTISKFVGNYNKYVTNQGDGLFGTSIMTAALICVYIFICIYFNKENISADRIMQAQLFVVFLGAIAYLFAIYSATLYRPALYFLTPIMLTPIVCTQSKIRNKYSKTLAIWAILFFTTYYGVFRLHQVVPYVLK